MRFLAVGAPDPQKADAIGEQELEAVRSHVQVVGRSNHVRELLAIMDVFVLPSWREGLPRSAIEAAAMAKPLVLTDIRGCREVVRDGVEGLLVPPRDPAGLAAAIRLLLEDPARRARLGATARALERFDERRVGELVAASYRRLLGAAGTGQPPCRAARRLSSVE